MKYFFTIFIILFSINAFSQDADSSDYFRAGIYGGMYIPNSNFYVDTKLSNTISIEAEYIKTNNIAFYLRGLFEKKPYYSYTDVLYVDKPVNYRLVISFGGRYYLNRKNIRPYVQIGLNQETNFTGKESYYYTSEGVTRYYSYSSQREYSYSVNFGLGLDIKILKKFSAVAEYNLYRVYTNVDDEKIPIFRTFSILAGIKYNLTF